MKHAILLTLLIATGTFACSQDVTGDWQGSLSAGGAELRLVLHITKGADGALKATLDSVDQGANGIPVNSVSLKNSKLSLGIDAVHGTYEGTVSANAKTISGTWTKTHPCHWISNAPPLRSRPSISRQSLLTSMARGWERWTLE